MLKASRIFDRYKLAAVALLVSAALHAAVFVDFQLWPRRSQEPGIFSDECRARNRWSHRCTRFHEFPMQLETIFCVGCRLPSLNTCCLICNV